MEKICSECTEPTLAQSLCTLCNKWLCYRCTDVHQHQRAQTASQYADSYQQQQRPSATQCPDLHQRGSSSLPPTGQGPGSYPCSLLMCHSHRQEPLELFCESCDLLCCSSCHLSSHKNHRVMQIGKALQDQRWLFESLMVQVEERRSAVENNAKQIEDRLHGVKIAHRKAENQIKMAKMIMMNELNKRANLLIEQLEKITEDFQQRLEDQLQGAIEMCGHLDHIQKFITWATTHHCRGPVLFSRALISLQMQQLLESSLHSDSWSPVKIKFNWDASYWTKHISSLGQLTVEGGNCSYPSGLACSSIMRPHPVTCFALPTMFHRGREPGCGYQQACCEPQMCCLHGISPQSDLASLDKSQVETTLYNSSCSQSGLISASLHQSQPLQRCWDAETSSQCPAPTSPVPVVGPLQFNCGRGSVAQAADSLPHAQSLSYLSCHQHQREAPPDSQTQLSAERGGPGPCTPKCSTSKAQQQESSQKVMTRDAMTEEGWEERCRAEETRGQTASVQSREPLDEELQADRGERGPGQLQKRVQAASAAEQQRTRPALTLRDHKESKRSTSLEVSVTAHECVSDVQSSRLSPSSVSTRRERRSRSIPTELAAPSTSSYSERSPGSTNSREAETRQKYDRVDSRQRRASDGVLCVVKETLSAMTPSRGNLPPTMSYKMEPDHPFTFVSEDVDYGATEKSRVPRSSYKSNGDVLKGSGKSRVPVVCLERLKILVAQLPPHGRRQSDPLPASEMDESDSNPQQSTWHNGKPGVSNHRGASRSLTAPPYAERRICSQSSTLSPNSDVDSHNSRARISSPKASTLRSTDLQYVPQSYSELDLDSDSDPRSVSEENAAIPVNPDPRIDSDTSPDSDPNAQSSSEAELESMTEGNSAAAGKMRLCGDSEPSLEYEADPESDAGAGSDDGPGMNVYSESGDAQTESDTQPEYDPNFQADSDSDAGSERPPDSQGSVDSELDVESDPELTTDDPQPLRSDLEEEPHVGLSQRPLLIANPVVQRGTEEVHSEKDGAEMESEDFCAVCLIGGELLCCDRCPKVYHLSCHIPPLLSFPSGDWVCSLCTDAVQPEVEYHCENERRPGVLAVHGLPASDQRKCERLTLLILSNILSAPFHEPVSPLARHYYQIIKRPMDLSVIRARLSKRNPRYYSSADQFVADVYLMFHNCAKFNYPDSEVAQAGRSLETFFTSKLKEVFPDRVFTFSEVDSDSDEYDEVYKTAEGGFPWPERREQSHRKRKRRQSLKSRRHHF